MFLPTIYPFDVHNVFKRLKKGVTNSTHFLQEKVLSVLMQLKKGVTNSTIVLS